MPSDLPGEPPRTAPPTRKRPALSKRASVGTRVWTAGRFLLLAGALTATFGVFFLTGMRVANRAREVKVPNLAGQSLDDANRSVAQAGLVLKVDQRKADPKVPADHVISQDPEAGVVLRRQRAIRVRVSDGTRDPVVPAVVGEAERTADISLAQEGVDVASRVMIRTARYPAGVIIAQDPPVKGRGAKLSLLVNQGEGDETYVMPDVVGTPSGRVIDILRRHGLRVTIGAEPSFPGLPSGVVVKQTPQAGATIADGGAVVLEVTK